MIMFISPCQEQFREAIKRMRSIASATQRIPQQQRRIPLGTEQDPNRRKDRDSADGKEAAGSD